ncbi:MAG: hypothetical protein LAO04_22845, partial [Acidobacteriia bacterium]|nr:hypothetical protein [Terriglobia bacterium]
MTSDGGPEASSISTTPETEGASPATQRSRRVALIKAIEAKRESRVITWICGDRQGSPQGQIGDDAVRPLYDHVRPIGKPKKLDVFLYSRGGAVEVPWRVISMFREHCTRLGVLIPYRAHSAATLIALGCDEIVLGRKAELGPIDPALSITQDKGTEVKEQIRVEEVMSFIAFIKEVAGLGDQHAIAENVRILTEKLSPWVLGSIYRTHSHIRMVARKMLACHTKRVDEQTANLIIESLAEKTYSHGHAIGRSEAKEIGLPATMAEEELDDLMWELLETYEGLLGLRTPIDPSALLGPNEEGQAPHVLAVIESIARLTTFSGTLKFRKVRQAPPQVNVNMTLGVSLPPNVNPATLPQQFQDAINRLVQEVQQNAPRWVQEQTIKQSPLLRIEGRLEDACWRDVPDEPIQS